MLDQISIILIIIPVAIAVLRSMGVDDVWFCIMFLVVIQTSYLTPPMAPAIFYLRGISPPEISLGDMYRGVVPFILLEFVCLGMIMVFPELAFGCRKCCSTADPASPLLTWKRSSPWGRCRIRRNAPVRKTIMAMPNVKLTYEVKPDSHAMLGRIAERYGLPDESKGTPVPSRLCPPWRATGGRDLQEESPLPPRCG